MKVRNRSLNLIPLFFSLSLLTVGVIAIVLPKDLALISIPDRAKEAFSEEIKSAQLNPQIYQIEIVNHQIKLTPKTINFLAISPELALKRVMEELFTPSSGSDSATTIPPGTQLLDIQVNNKGVFLNLSTEFTEGGGSSSMIYRVAQVLFTATSLDPETAVFLSIEGKALDQSYPLGGEGLLLDYPLTRQRFSQDFLLYE